MTQLLDFPHQNKQVLTIRTSAKICKAMQRYYRNTAREIRRLNSIARTPVYSGFCEVLEGGPTIRAANQQSRFASMNENAVGLLQQTTIAGLLPSQTRNPAVHFFSVHCSALSETYIGVVWLELSPNSEYVRRTKY